MTYASVRYATNAGVNDIAGVALLTDANFTNTTEIEGDVVFMAPYLAAANA